MSKLVSLKEKPATYCCCNCGSIEQVIIGYEAKQGGDEKQIRCGNCHRYSSFNNEDKPIGFIMVKLISEQEYNELKQGQINKDDLCKGCYWEENKPLTPVCDTCRIIRSNHKGYEHSLADTKTEEYNG